MVAQDLLDAGVPAESTGAYGNVLTRCFGMDGEPVPVDVFHVKLAVNDRILLCSDGLSDLVIDAEIEALINEASSNAEDFDALVLAALLAGGETISLLYSPGCLNPWFHIRSIVCTRESRKQTAER